MEIFFVKGIDKIKSASLISGVAICVFATAVYKMST